jgi:peptide/nickel transport system substrate-binding protein
MSMKTSRIQHFFGRRRAGHHPILWLVGVAILALVLGLVACGKGGETPTTAAGTQTTAAGTGNPFICVYGLETPPYQTYDPAQDSTTCATWGNVYESLVRYDSTTKEFVPWLATSWETSSDGLTWTFHLRQGVKFQDGTPFNAAAAKFSFEHMSTGVWKDLLYGAFDSVTATDDYTLVIHLKTARSLLDQLASYYGQWMISPTAVQKYGDKAFDPGNGAGTGPYYFASATTTEVQLKRFADYWGGWEGTHANAPDLAVIRQVTESAVRVQGLEQGDLQVISSAASTDLKKLGSDPKYKIWATPSVQYVTVVLNTKKTPTDDKNLRAALIYAYPYQQVCDVAYGGYAQVSIGPFKPPEPGYDYEKAHMSELFIQPVQDMDKAREYLAKSAYPNGGCTVVVHADSTSGRLQNAMELWRTALAPLHITLDVVPTDPNQMFNDGQDPTKAPQNVFAQEVNPGFPSAANTIESDLASWTPTNWAGWKSTEFDTDLKEAYVLQATNPDAYPQKILDAWKLAQEDFIMLRGGDIITTPVADAKLQGFTGYTGDGMFLMMFYDLHMAD